MAAAVVVALLACSDGADRRAAEVGRTDSALIPLEDTGATSVVPAEVPVPAKSPEPTASAPPSRLPAEGRSTPEASGRTQRPAPVVEPEPVPADTVPPEPPSHPTSEEDTTPSILPTPPRPDTVGTSRPVPPRTPAPVVPRLQSSSGVRGDVTVPAGTELQAALLDSIHSRHDSAGRSIEARVMENVRGLDGRTLVPAGAVVHLTVTRLEPARSKSAAGALELRVDGITPADSILAVAAEVRPVPHELRGRGVTGSEAAKVGAGAAAGAIAGRVLGGDTRGAVIGGVVGAAGGAVVAAETANRDVVVKAGTPITLVLTAPLVAGQL
ncbi:MAG TPA: hypothetical protein VFZ26_10790 [Gemmatimonadales bacterium]